MTLRYIRTITLLLALAAVMLAQTPTEQKVAVGGIITVNGVIEAEALGLTLIHEHLLADFNLPDDRPDLWRAAGLTFPDTAQAIDFYHRSISMNMLGSLVAGRPNRDNWYLTDERVAVREAIEFKAHGGQTIVDATNLGLKRDPLGLRRLANVTGLHIVMGSGWYQKLRSSPALLRRSIESLSDEIVREITLGCDNTDVRAGIIGEISVTNPAADEEEGKVLRAAARASARTGAAILIDCPASSAIEALNILKGYGADPMRIIMANANSVLLAPALLEELLSRGVFLQFTVGKYQTVHTRVSDTDVAKAVVALIRQNRIRQILLSHNLSQKIQLKSLGGTGYTYLPELFLPYLKKQGVTEEQIKVLMRQNPQRALTLVFTR
jgi:phosphotriesterase-related protein